MRFVIFVVFMAIIIGACGSDPRVSLSEQTLGDYMEDNVDISARVETVDGMTQIIAEIGTSVCGVDARGDGVCDDPKMLCEGSGVRVCHSDCHEYFTDFDCLREWIEEEYNDGNELDSLRHYCFRNPTDRTSAHNDCGISVPDPPDDRPQSSGPCNSCDFEGDIRNQRDVCFRRAQTRASVCEMRDDGNLCWSSNNRIIREEVCSSGEICRVIDDVAQCVTISNDDNDEEDNGDSENGEPEDPPPPSPSGSCRCVDTGEPEGELQNNCNFGFNPSTTCADPNDVCICEIDPT